MDTQEYRDEIELAQFGILPVGTAPPLRLAGEDLDDDAASFFTIVRGID
ncbi:hypothetical protein ACIQUQ_32345 [Streptomyces sp. NPDC101118]